MLITLLLLTACVAMLTAVGANSRDTTDVISDTKAYYAAESGLQATINVLRNDSSVNYAYAVSHPALDLKLPYTTVNGISQVRVGNEAGYRINIIDPDNSTASVTFFTNGWFFPGTGTTLASGGKKVCIPDCQITTTDRTEISWTDASSTFYNFTGPNPSLGRFSVAKFGAGAAISANISFQIDYKLTNPRPASRSIRGWVNPTAANANVTVSFLTEEYTVVGSNIELCSTVTPSPNQANACPNISPVTVTTSSAVPINAYITPVEPYRLLVTSTGYGPNGSKKQLEGILQKNFLNDDASSSGLTMVGPGANLSFSPGQGNPTYCGVDPGIQPGQTIPSNPTCTIDPNAPSLPAIGVSDPAGLQNVLNAAGNTQIVPPPAVITDGPSWQQSPQALNDFINRLRATAQSNGRYLSTSANLQNTNNAVPYINVSEWTSGENVTVIDGNADIGPLSGGGILVVTGNLTYNGNFNFRGTIIVTGSGGVTRSGSGSGVILGNMVIAPYDPSNLGAGFGSPHFATNGGGNSDLMFSGLSTNFDGTDAISNFMLGVAEK
jgi:hypothetical protein